MVLLSFLLVLAAAVTLVIGLLNVGLGLIYASIVCSVLAGIVLAVAVVRSREPLPELAGGGTGGPPSFGGGPAREPVRVGGAVALGEAAEDEEEPTILSFAPVGGREPAAGGYDDEYEFPIADYDDLRVSEILPLLPELDPDELEMVREREESGSARATILSRIDRLADGGFEPAPPVRKAASRATATKRSPAKKATKATRTTRTTRTAAKATKSTASRAKKATATKKAATKATRARKG